MYKLMIVDDESRTRQTLFRYVPWTEIGIADVEQAEDGRHALQLSEIFAPDIVLTDVRMPRMNGIELARELRTRLPRCKVIFLSAYSDVDYLKNAIKLQAFDYIEKPLDLDEVGRIVQSAVSVCDADQQQWDRERRLQGQELMLIKQQLALSLCGNGVKPIAGQKSELNHPDIHFPLSGTFVSLVFQGRTAGSASGNAAYQPIPELMLLERLLSDIGVCCLTAPLKHEGWVLQAAMPSPSTLPLLRKAVWDYIEMCRSKQTDMFAAVGGAVDALTSLPDSYNQAHALAKRLFYVGYSQVLVLDCDFPLVYSFDPLLAEKWLRYLCNHQPEEAERLIRQFTQQLRCHPDTPAEQVKHVFYTLFHQLCQWIQKYAGLSVRDHSDRLPLPDASAFDTLSTLDEYEELLLQELQSASVGERGRTGSIVSRMIHIIREQAGNQNLTINAIAGQLFLTPSYICLLFKNETGMTVNQYLTSVRMEMAKNLIAKYKIHEVATQVGYTDTKYFTKIFKKEVGWTPSEYKERLRL
ncbi:response regulator [Paenibacillus sp. GCM10027626]|uniref:response regulator n=1 Tax=Paenibacillus sp. GCM10027626 TaxID=3273411 RepID=UPI00363FA8A4